jgi:hypothetical protein
MLLYASVALIEPLDTDRTRRTARYHRATHPEHFPSVASRVATRVRKAMGIARLSPRCSANAARVAPG